MFLSVNGYGKYPKEAAKEERCFVFLLLSVNSNGKYPKDATKVARVQKLRI